MPSIAVIIIQQAPGGISIEQLPIQKGTELERAIAGVMDIGLKLTQEALMAELSRCGKPGTSAIEIEGKNIENAVNAGLKAIRSQLNMRQLLNDAGFKVEGKD